MSNTERTDMVASLHKAWSQLGALRVMCVETRALKIALKIDVAQAAVDEALLELQPVNSTIPLKMEFPTPIHD